MAGGAVIGALRVVLGADTADLDKGLKDSQSAVASWAKNMAQIAGGIGLEKALEGFVASAVNSIKHGVELGDQLNKMSQKAGVTVEEFARLKYAAELSDVSVEALGKSMGKLSKALVEAATDATSKAGRAFAAMGVEVQNSDGSIRNQSEVLGDVAEKFKGYKDGAEKTALAISIFGKAGADLIPLLNQGRDAIKDAGDEAQKFGLVLDKQTTMAAEAFMDNLKRLDSIKQGLFTTIAARLLPALVQLSEQFLETKKSSTLTADAADFVTNSIKFLANEVAVTVEQFRGLGRELVAIKEFLSAVGDINDLKVAWKNWNDVVDANEKSLAGVKSALTDAFTGATSFANRWGTMWDGQIEGVKSLNAQVLTLATTWSTVAAPKVADNEAQKNALDAYIISQQKSIAAHKAEFDAAGMAAGAKERLKVIDQAAAIQTANKLVMDEQQRVKLTELANAAELLALKMGNFRLIGESNPLAAIGLAIDATNVKMQSGILSAQDYAILSGQAAQLSAKLWADSATSLGGSFESIGSSLSSINEGWAQAAKVGQAIGAAVAFVNAYVAASQAFATTPFPGNVAIAAGVLAKGIAMVAAIKSAAVPKMAMGGAFTVPGGLGGGDKFPFMAMLEPGERVEVSSNHANGYQSDNRAAGSGAGRSITIPFRGIVGIDGVRQLMDEISSAMSDGYKFNVVPA